MTRAPYDPRLLTVTRRLGSYTSSRWHSVTGGTSTIQHPTYRYKKPGVYTVSLGVSGPNGTSTATRPAYIVVSAL